MAADIFEKKKSIGSSSDSISNVSLVFANA